MTDMLRQMIDHASAWAEKRFAKHGRLFPMWHAITADGEQLVLSPPTVDKDTSAMIMRGLFEARNVVRCVFIDEAWTVHESGPPDALEAWLAEHGSLEHHPARIEVVMFQGEDIATGMISARRLIERTPHGKPKLGPLELLDLSNIQTEGRLIGMLPRKGALQ